MENFGLKIVKSLIERSMFSTASLGSLISQNFSLILIVCLLVSMESGNVLGYIVQVSSGGDTTGNKTMTLSISCITPFKGMEISESTLLCGGTYRIDAGIDESVIYVKGDNLVIRGNNTHIIGNALNNKGISISNYKNVTIEDLDLDGYNYSIYASNLMNAVFVNLTLNNSWQGLTASYCSNITLKGSRVSNANWLGMSVFASSNVSIISNDFGAFSGKHDNPQGMYFENSQFINVEENTLRNLDKGVWIVSGSSNVVVKNNGFYNMTLNTDGYNLGIFVFTLVNNVTIVNNYMKDIGSVGVLLMKGCSNVGIINNSIDLYNLSLIDRTQSNDYSEPPAGIFISEIYKKWLSDCTEHFSDNILKVSSYASKDITILNNSFGPNVQIPLRIQGDGKVVHDLKNYWFRRVQFPTHLVDADEFFITDDTYTVRSYTFGVVTDVQQKGFGDIDLDITREMIDYKINKSVLSFKNADNAIVYNVSLIEPRILLFGSSCLVSNRTVNVSLPSDMQWYHSINFSVTPSQGVSSVYVSAYSPNFVHWTLSGPGSGSVDNMVCGLISSGLYNASSGGALDRVIRASSGGCVDYNVSASSSARSFDLVYQSGSGPDFSVSSTGIGLSNNSPMVGQSVSVFVNVSNLGGVGVSSSVRGYDGLPGAGLPVWSGNVFFPAYSTVQVSFPWIPSVAGSRTVYFVVDEDGRIDESNEGNNVAARAFTVQSSGSTTTTTSSTSTTSTSTASTSTTTSTVPLNVLRVLGAGMGTGLGELYDPSDVAVDSKGDVFVLEAYNGRIQEFGPDGSFYNVYGSSGSLDPGRLGSPDSIVLRELGSSMTEIAVADSFNHRVQLLWLNDSYPYWTTFGERFAGVYRPTTHIYFEYPRGVDLGSDGRVLVSDTGDDRVSVFANSEWGAVPKAENGLELNGSSTPAGLLNVPTGIAAEGDVFYVVDSGANRIRGFYANGSEFLVFGGAGSGRGGFNAPGGIVLDHQGRMYVADTGNNRVVVYTIDGRYVTSYGVKNCSGDISSRPYEATGQFCSPRGLDVRDGMLYVADSGNNRVQVINVTALPEPSCILIGDEEPCGRVTVAEILDLITRWAWGGASVTDVIQLITAWAVQ